MIALTKASTDSRVMAERLAGLAQRFLQRLSEHTPLLLSIAHQVVTSIVKKASKKLLKQMLISTNYRISIKGNSKTKTSDSKMKTRQNKHSEMKDLHICTFEVEDCMHV